MQTKADIATGLGGAAAATWLTWGGPGHPIGGSCRRINHLPIADPYRIGNQRVAAQIGFYEPHRRGAHAESVALSWLLNEGYFVFTNFAGRGPVDLVAIDSGTPNVTLIDVKAAIYTGLSLSTFCCFGAPVEWPGQIPTPRRLRDGTPVAVHR